ncbi:MAG: hypothetical protein L0211_13745 [Planctomycetaceae bacterium]|nr:hypothetical protein [Planctomycetaceae bacterium]
MALTAIACVLAVVWLGNTVMTIWLREAATPEALRGLLSLGLVLYSGWHFTKAAFFRPESPFDLPPAERDLLVAMPLLPRDLMAYQFASVMVTTVFKAGLLALLLLPDLRCVPLALAGLVLVMLTLEILRMAIDIATWGMNRSAFLTYRAAVLAGLVAGGAAVGAVVVHEFALGGPLNLGEEIVQSLREMPVRINNSAIGYVALPFWPFIDLILADALTAPKLGLAAAAMTTVTALAAAVIGLYTATVRMVINRERRNYSTDIAAHKLSTNSDQHQLGPAHNAEFRLPLRRFPRWGGVSALAGRQLVGARRHWGSLITAMIAPAVLASAPCFVIADPHMALLSTTGTLAFYTFLLLPTALRFDFRRDLDRLAMLKGLPVTPAAAAIGQMLAPVLLATLFQCGVLAFAIIARSLPLPHFFVAMLAMIPLNVLVFGLDNLIYLLYPYRMQQEGLEIFVRTTLTFTGKGLLFVVGLAVAAGWGLAATALTRGLSEWGGSPISAFAVFVGGSIAGLALMATIVLYALCRTYRNLDPLADIPR